MTASEQKSINAIGLKQATMEQIQEGMVGDISEVKTSIKEIKVFLMGSETQEAKIVTRREFDSYKNAQIWQKALIGVSFTFIGALITYFIQNITK